MRAAGAQWQRRACGAHVTTHDRPLQLLVRRHAIRRWLARAPCLCDMMRPPPDQKIRDKDIYRGASRNAHDVREVVDRSALAQRLLGGTDVDARNQRLEGGIRPVEHIGLILEAEFVREIARDLQHSR